MTDDTTDERRKALRVIQAQLNSSAKLDPESLRVLLEHQRLLVAMESRSLPLRPETRDALIERLNRATCTDADNITVPVAALREVVRASDPTRGEASEPQYVSETEERRIQDAIDAEPPDESSERFSPGDPVVYEDDGRDRTGTVTRVEGDLVFIEPSAAPRHLVTRPRYEVLRGRIAPEPPAQPDPGTEHLIGGKFQSDKYPTCPRGKVPLSTKDPMAQDLLWEYVQRRRSVDEAFARDLEVALRNDGYEPVSPDAEAHAIERAFFKLAQEWFAGKTLWPQGAMAERIQRFARSFIPAQPNWPRAQKQGWGLSTYTGDLLPIPTYGPGSRFAESPRHTGEPPSGDTPEAIARDAVYGDQSNEGNEDRIAARIRALVVGARIDELARWVGGLGPVDEPNARHRLRRLRALESGGGK